MAGRDVTEVRFRFSGDKRAAQSLSAFGRKLLGMVKEQMNFQGLSQYELTKELPDGSTITAMSRFGQDEVRVFVPSLQQISQPAYTLPRVLEINRIDETLPPQVVCMMGDNLFPFNFNPTIFGGVVTRIDSDMTAAVCATNMATFGALMERVPEAKFLGRCWAGVYTESITEVYGSSLINEYIEYSARPLWKFIPKDVALSSPYNSLVGLSMATADIQGSTQGVGADTMWSRSELWWDSPSGFNNLSTYKSINAGQNIIDALQNVPWESDRLRVAVMFTGNYFDSSDGGSNYYVGAQCWDDKFPTRWNAWNMLVSSGQDGVVLGIADKLRQLGIALIIVPVRSLVARSGTVGLGLDNMLDMGAYTGGATYSKYVNSHYTGEYGQGTYIDWDYIYPADNWETLLETYLRSHVVTNSQTVVK